MVNSYQMNVEGVRYLLFGKWLVLLFLIVGPCPVSADEGYKLGGGDTIRIRVYEQPDLTITARISQDDQTIVYPLLGEVALGGLTPEAAGGKIARLLKEGGFIRSPQVTLSVEQFESQKIPIMGAVQRPGEYPLEGESRVVDLIAQAGGVREDAADVIIIVKDESGQSVKHEIDLLRFYAGDMSQNIKVSTGDFILVPKMDAFYIHGEVQRPGMYRLEREMTVMQAISVAGGVTERGSLKGMTVTREQADGGQEKIKLKMSDKLQTNDVLYVKERLF